MSEDIVSKLASFGFTVNQAKVYLSIVQSGRTRVGKISKTTQLHRQDIYKLLPKLEKMGLITRTIDKPFMIEAIPFEKALDNVISKEREKANARISSLEKNLKEMINAIQRRPELKEEARFTLLTTDEAIKNKGQYIFKKPRRHFFVVTSDEYVAKAGPNHFRDFLQNIVVNGAKIRLVIVSSDTKTSLKQTVEKVLPKNGQILIRYIHKSVCKNFQIIDNKEAWLATQQKTELGYPCILWTNDANIVDAYKEHFKKIWNDPAAKTLHHSAEPKEIVPTVKDEPLMPSVLS